MHVREKFLLFFLKPRIAMQVERVLKISAGQTKLNGEFLLGSEVGIQDLKVMRRGFAEESLVKREMRGDYLEELIRWAGH